MHREGELGVSDQRLLWGTIDSVDCSTDFGQWGSCVGRSWLEVQEYDMHGTDV